MTTTESGEAADDGAGQRRVLLAARFEAEGHGNHAEQRGQRSHQNGAQANLAGLHGCFAEAAFPARGERSANSTIRMLFETTMPVIMMTPISDMMFSVLPVSSRMSTTPARPGGMAMRMMNGSMNEANCAIRIR